MKIIEEFFEIFSSLRERTKEMKNSKGKFNSRITQKENNDIQKQLQELQRKYEKYKSENSVYPPGIKSELGKKLTSEIEGRIGSLRSEGGRDQNGHLIWELEQLLDDIGDLQDPLADEIDRMKLIPEKQKGDKMKKIQAIHEKIQVELLNKGVEYKKILQKYQKKKPAI